MIQRIIQLINEQQKMSSLFLFFRWGISEQIINMFFVFLFELELENPDASGLLEHLNFSTLVWRPGLVAALSCGGLLDGVH